MHFAIDPLFLGEWSKMVKAWRRWIAIIGSGWMLVTLSAIMYQLFTGVVLLDYVDSLAGYTEQIVQYLNAKCNPWDKEAMKIVFPTLGLAGSIVPAVYGSRRQKVKGILIHNMTKYFFPFYGLFMTFNLIISMAGQICTVMNITQTLKYLLSGSILSVLYAFVLVLGTGLNERITKFYIKGYINDHISKLQVSAKHVQQSKYRWVRRHYQKCRNKRAKFLAALTSHIAKQTSDAKTPYCITDKSLKREIRQVFKLISYQTVKQNKALKNRCGFIESFEIIFQYATESVETNSCCNCVYFELPASELARSNFADQVESACEFLQIALESANNIEKEAKAVCRIIHALVFENDRLQENYVIICCGLVACLYKKYHSIVDNSGLHEIERCALFVDQMVDIFRGEAGFLDKPVEGLRDALHLCADMLYTIWVIAEVEAYSAPNIYELYQVNEAVDRLIFGEHGYVGRSILSRLNTTKYLCLAWCLIMQIPSVARKAVTVEQKRELMNYILEKIHDDGR